MSDPLGNILCELLRESLAAWRMGGIVEPLADGGIVIDGNRKTIQIVPAQPASVFRWMVTIDGRKRGAISLIGVLRQVREAIDPGYAASRVRVTVAPLMSS